MSTRPFTPETLAERWGCSAEKVRQMIRRGDLRAFRLGKLIRIPANEAERVECLSMNSMTLAPSFNTEVNSRLRSGEGRDAGAFRLARMIRG